MIDRLEDVLDSAATEKLVQHKMCYAHFASKIERLQRIQAEHSKEEASCSSGVSGGDRCLLRIVMAHTNWNMHFLSNH